METKNEKFRRLAESRATSIIKTLHLIGNLSNKRNYDYSDEEVNELFRTIERELKDTKKLFKNNSLKSSDTSFKFSSKKP